MYSDMSMRRSAFLVVEQKQRERLGQFRLADAGRPEEHERADRPVRVLQTRAGAAHGGGDRLHGFPPGRSRAYRSLPPCEGACLFRLRASARPERRSSARRRPRHGRASRPLPPSRSRFCFRPWRASSRAPGFSRKSVRPRAGNRLCAARSQAPRARRRAPP